MSKITSPLQALEAIRTLCVPALTETYEMLRRKVEEAATAGIAHAVPLPAPTRKAARDLVPGDVLLFGATRAVVTFVEPDPDRTRFSVSVVLLGADEPVRVNPYLADSQFTVEAPAGLTPVQAAADRLHDLLRAATTVEHERERIALLDELDPPKPPTLDEALALLRALVLKELGLDRAMEAASKLLARVPK